MESRKQLESQRKSQPKGRFTSAIFAAILGAIYIADAIAI